MIAEDYVSFEIAKLLKEKGFDKFNTYGWDEQLFDKDHPRNFSIGFDNKEHWISCPSQSMAMKWLREVYDIFIDIGYDDLDWYWLIESISKDIPYADRPKLIKNGTACHKTYEEAVEAALKYSLENLI